MYGFWSQTSWTWIPALSCFNVLSGQPWVSYSPPLGLSFNICKIGIIIKIVILRSIWVWEKGDKSLHLKCCLAHNKNSINISCYVYGGGSGLMSLWLPMGEFRVSRCDSQVWNHSFSFCQTYIETFLEENKGVRFGDIFPKKK